MRTICQKWLCQASLGRCSQRGYVCDSAFDVSRPAIPPSFHSPQPSRSYPALQTRSRTIRPVPIQTAPTSGRPRATTPPIIPIPESRQSQFRPSPCDDLPEVALPRVLGQVLPAGIDRLDVCDPHPIPPRPLRSYPHSKQDPAQSGQSRSRPPPRAGAHERHPPPIIPIPESRQSQFRPSLCVLSARSGSATRPWAGAPSGDRPPRRL